MLRNFLVSAFFLFGIFGFTLFTNPAVYAAQGEDTFESLRAKAQEEKITDRKVKIVEDYLSKYNSPLKGSARDFVEAAEKYDLDWKLVVSIAGVESTFGKFIPGGHQPGFTTYNCWGWGVYGDQALGFKSWKDGIYTVSEGLKKNYVDKGFVTPFQMNRIYAASPTWGTKVTYFMNDLDKFAKNYEDIGEATEIKIDDLKLEAVSASGKLASSN